MSKTTKKLEYVPFARFLNQLAINNRWLDLWPQALLVEPKQSVSVISTLGEITIYGASYHGNVKKPSPNMYVCIKISPHVPKNLFLIERFEVFSSTGKTLSISEKELLEHYSKRCVVNEDFKKDDVSDLWTISCPKDLESLLRAYDSLSKFYGFPTVFNIP